MAGMQTNMRELGCASCSQGTGGDKSCTERRFDAFFIHLFASLFLKDFI